MHRNDIDGIKSEYTAEAFAVVRSIEEIQFEVMRSGTVDPNAVLRDLETDRARGFAGKPVTAAPFYFEASLSRPGFLDKVDTASGERQTGTFRNGKFEPIS
jgi:hypothetical protein